MSALSQPRYVASTAPTPFPEQALECFFASREWKPVEGEDVALEAACGRVAVDNFVTPYALPSRPHSAVDGYAIRSADLAGERTLRCSLEPRSGKLSVQSVRRGEAVRVPAGAILPPGSDVVIPLDSTDAANGLLRIVHHFAPGENVVPIGADVRAMQTLIRGGSVLSSADLGILAAFGLSRILVRRRPSIALITFGDEVVAQGRTVRPWEAYDINRYVIGATLGSWGARVIPLHAKRVGGLSATITMALQHADAIVISGDTPAERRSAVAAAIETLRPGGVLIEGVRMMPGGATVVGSVGTSPIIGLPANPTAALLTLCVIGEPIIRRLVGRTEKAPPQRLTVTETIYGKHGWDCVVPVRTESGACAPIGTSSYHSIFARADGFVRVSSHVGRYHAGSVVDVERLS